MRLVNLVKKALPFALTAIISSAVSVTASINRFETLAVEKVALMRSATSSEVMGLMYTSTEHGGGILALKNADGSNVIIDAKGISFYDRNDKVRFLLGLNGNTPFMGTVDASGKTSHNLLKGL